MKKWSSPEEKKAYYKEYYKANRAAILARSFQWAINNHDQYNSNHRKAGKKYQRNNKHKIKMAKKDRLEELIAKDLESIKNDI